MLVLSMRTGDILHRLEGHEGSVTALAATVYGKLIDSGYIDRTVQRWDGGGREASGRATTRA